MRFACLHTLQDHEYALPQCPNDDPENFSWERSRDMSRTPNPPERQRRRAPSPPTPGPHHRSLRIRTNPRPSPYVPPHRQPLEQPRIQPLESGNNTTIRGRNLFEDFIGTLPRPFPAPAAAAAAPTPSPTRIPSPDVMQELYQHTRHPLDLRTHLTIVPSWPKRQKRSEVSAFYAMKKENICK